MTSQIWNTSNVLSMSRAVLTLPIIYTLHMAQTDPDYYYYSFFLIFIAGITDLLDGYFARKLNQVTELGKVIDPIADKIISSVVMLYLAITRPDFPRMLLTFALTRDAIIFFGALYIKKRYGIVLTSNMIGKIAFTVLGFSFLTYVLGRIVPMPGVLNAFVIASYFLLSVSFIVYAVRVIKLVRLQN